ncbi:MAG: type IV secretion protein Dot [Legionella sp.]
MFSKFNSLFFSPVVRSSLIAPKDWLQNQLISSGLNAAFPAHILRETQPTAKVFFNKQYLSHTNGLALTLDRALTKIPAVNVDGDRAGRFQNGSDFPKDKSFFRNIPTGHNELLSPAERLNGAKKIIHSLSEVIGFGGYPADNPKQLYKNPVKVGLFSLAGAVFENDYLHYKLFMLDRYQSTVDPGNFAHLFKDLPTQFAHAKRALEQDESNSKLMHIRTGLPLLARSTSGNFYSGFSKQNAVIFLSEAYFRHQLEDISLLLTSVNKSAEQAGKPALLKATAVGMGFFAKVNDVYDIQHVLFPNYLRAFHKLLTEQSYPWIEKIEFPIFNDLQRDMFDTILKDAKSPVTLVRTTRDVLEFGETEIKNNYIAAVNPSDTFAYTGNEWGYDSVEAMIGNNSSLRYDQVPNLNPEILKSENQIAVEIKEDFSATILPTEDLSIRP